MEVVVFRSKADGAMQEIEGLYRRLVGTLSGAKLNETDGLIYGIEPDLTIMVAGTTPEDERDFGVEGGG